MKSKKIYLLIGPKGAGKSFIGVLIEKTFGVKFLRVEDWAKEVNRSRRVDNSDYVNEVFHVIEARVREAIQLHDEVVFESTGLTESFDSMLMNLKRDYEVVTIGIQANNNLCLDRMKTRDHSIHVNVSDQDAALINTQVRQKNQKTNFVIVNEGKRELELIHEMKKIFYKQRSF